MPLIPGGVYNRGFFIFPERPVALITDFNPYVHDKKRLFNAKNFEKHNVSKSSYDLSEEVVNQLMVIFKKIHPEFNPLADRILVTFEKRGEDYSSILIQTSYTSNN